MISKKLVVFISVAAVSIAVGLLPHRLLAGSLFESSSYYFIFTLFFIWVAQIIRSYRARLKEGIRRHYPLLLFCLALTTLIFISSPPRFKILADEANLIGVSKMMHETRSTTQPIEGISSDFGDSNYLTMPDKRPLLFPFLVSVVHALAGYSPSNGFYVNFVAAWAVLVLLYLTTIRLLPVIYGWLAVLLAAGAPITMINVTSSGFESVNLLFVLFYFLFLMEVLASGGEVKEIELLLVTTFLLAQCRYESLVFIPIVALFLLPMMIKTKFARQMSVLTCIMPAFLIPVLWQRKLFMGTNEFNKIGHETFEVAGSVFSFTNLGSNFDDNIFVLLGWNPNYGFTPLLSIMAIAGIYLLVKTTIRRKPCEISLPLLIQTLVSAAALFLIISSYFWGNFGLTMDNRLSLVFLPFLVWPAVYALFRLEKRLQNRFAVAMVLFAVAHLVFFWSYGTQQRIVNTLSLQYEYNRVLNFLEPRYPKNGNTLIIAEQPNLYIIHNYSSIRFRRVDKIMEILAHPNSVDHIIALQKIEKRSGRIAKDSILEGFEVQPLVVFSLSPELEMRISSCEMIDRQ